MQAHERVCRAPAATCTTLANAAVPSTASECRAGSPAPSQSARRSSSSMPGRVPPRSCRLEALVTPAASAIGLPSRANDR